MPDSHQEDNAEIFKEKEAAIVLDQKKIDSDMFLGEIRKLLGDNDLQKKLSENIGRVIKKGADETILMLIKKMLN